MNYYFAYGSNISSIRLKERCPKAKFICLAYLKDHTLSFPQHCGKGHLVAGYSPDKSEKLWGVIYSIEETEVQELFKAEGYRENRPSHINSYSKVRDITLYDEHGIEISHDVFTFRQNKESSQPPEGKPHSGDYLKHIIAGYEEFNISKYSKKKYHELLQLIANIKNDNGP